ncbi:putative DNA helicase chromatin remodeling SNF2 family [Helianthus debilis subsp. tardiflorus]
MFAAMREESHSLYLTSQMSGSKIPLPPLQPGESWKRKYSTSNAQVDANMGARSSKQARHRASMLAKRGQIVEIHNRILPYYNKLHDHRNKGQNAVLFDGQDRIVKVITFVSSLLDNMKKPILIIASSSARLLWENEFSKWSKSINVVTYKGTKDIRAAIRGSEFQVLLSSPDAIVEDMETLVHIKWELLVIDECQHPVISMHLKTIQMLMADMKLLTIFGEPVDIFQISLVDCKNEKIQSDADMEMNDDISTLKERLSPFIAFDCKFSTPDLKEYWVPVHLSSTQDRHDTLNLNRTELNPKSTPKDTSTVKVLQISASTLVQPNNPYMINGPTTGPLRFQAPHLRSSPSSFASFRNQPTSSEPEPSLEPLPSLSATQTVDKHDHV